MSIAKIVWAVSILAALVFAFVSFEYAGAILAVLGLASGYFVSADHRRGLLVAAIFLLLGHEALGAIPVLGEHLNAILGSYSNVLSAACVTVIVVVTVQRLMPAKSE
ncbi:hypothetical protein F1654_00700 [Alkalicaulis satelles]|uniref:Uncharacterized protein n=1 Tax=Alkalicaulis satelles TaxID=2609175 RepID=A0A5M6ZIA1_9PROT|nr:hypothetical protein [Alkalicaulis satelles]KAA5804562.1 hypothetical protein F1654_00700 [Alkalicaulis satelles]